MAVPVYVMRMGEYRDVRHLYVTVRYAGKAANPYSDETWQTGWRLAASAQGPLDTDSGRVQLNTIEVQDAYVGRQSTNFDIDQGFSGITGSGAVITDADQDEIAEILLTWCEGVKIMTSNNYVLESIRIYPVGPDGKSRTAPSIYKPRVSTANPTGTSMLPADCAIAISTVTATRGVKGRGRQFLGAPAQATVDNTGLISLNTRQTMSNVTANVFTAWRSMAGVVGDYAFSPIVWHRQGDKQGLEDGTYGSPVRAVRVDDHMDTQRRRDRQVTHQWTVATL